MLRYSILCFYILMIPMIYGDNIYDILRLDGSGRKKTFGEAAISVPNSDNTSLLETPTSGLTHSFKGTVIYGMSKGEGKDEYGTDLTKGRAINIHLATPLPTPVKAGIMITGTQQNYKREDKDSDSIDDTKYIIIGAHGIMDYNGIIYSLSINNQKMESEYFYSFYNTYRDYSQGNWESTLYFFSLGVRYKLSSLLSVGATYEPNATSTFNHEWEQLKEDQDPNSDTLSVTKYKYKDIVYRNESLGVACSYLITDFSIILAGGIKRYFPNKITVEGRDYDLKGMTKISFGLEKQVTLDRLFLTPRTGIHVNVSRNYFNRSFQLGATLSYEMYLIDLSIGYNKISNAEGFNWNFYSSLIGLGITL